MPLEDHPTDPDKYVYKSRQYQIDCPTCEYHKQRAQIWRDEVYRLAGHPLPRKENMTEEDDDIQDYKKPWVGLTDEEIENCFDDEHLVHARNIERLLKEKNT
jgi:hypothetical protein